MPPGRPRAACGLAALLLSALWLTGGCAAQWTVLPGQPLADAATAWGLQNSDATFVLPAASIVSLRDATFRRANNSQARGGQAYANGTFTIQGSVQVNATADAAVPTAVVDAGMRVGLVPMLLRPAVVGQDTAWVNLCWNQLRLLGIELTTPLLMGILSLSPAVVSFHLERTFVYMPRSTLALSMYVGVVAQTPERWGSVREAYTRQLGNLGVLFPQTVIRFTTAYELNMRSLLLPMLDGNGIMRSLDAPDDPLLQFMRKEGLLMEPLWCNGSGPVAPQLADAVIDPVWGPLWMGDTQAKVASAIVNATAAAAAQRAAQRPVPAALIFTPTVALPEALLPAGELQAEAPLLLWGPFNEDPARLIPRVDLTNRTSALVAVGATGQVFVQRLALVVPALPLGASDDVPTTMGATVASALPLAALAAASGSGARTQSVLELHNVTLVVPALDFLAALMLATDGTNSSVRACMDNATLWHAARLAPGIQVVQLGPARPPSWEGGFALAAFTAWGVNATDLLIQPQTPVPASVVQQCAGLLQPSAPPPAATATSGDDGSSSTSVGLIVGCTVGGVVLLAALAAAATVLWRRKRQRSAEGDANVEASLCSECLRSPKETTKAILTRARPDGANAGRKPRPDAQPPLALPLPPSSPQGTGTVGSGAIGARHGRRHGDSTLSASASLLALLQSQEQQLLGQFGMAAVAPPPLPPLPPRPSGGSGGRGRQSPGRAAGTTSKGTTRAPSPSGRGRSPAPTGGRAGSGGVSSGASSGGAASSGGRAPASSLSQVHEQLMSALVARASPAPYRPTAAAARDAEKSGEETPAGVGGGGSSKESGGSGSQPSGSLHPRDSVKEAAARLQGQGAGDGADTVVLKQVLGRGGSGTVYLGTWRGLPVAVKTMVFEAWEDGADDHGGDGGGAAPSKTHLRYVRAIMETAISASVGHRHVVATYHYDIKRVNDQLADGERPSGGAGSLQVKGPAASLEITHSSAASGIQAFKVFLVQELCTCSLRTVLHQGVFVNETLATKMSTVVQVLSQIASGLEYLHGQGIIHGDLTPANILLKMDDAAPGGVLVKLADFGLSMRLDANATHVSNFGAGTPFYVAPEVVNQRRTSLAADMFSFGIITWQLFSGQSPAALSPATGAVVRNPLFPRFPAHEPPPPVIEKLFRRCIHVDPRQRPTSSEARAVLAELEKQLELPS